MSGPVRPSADWHVDGAAPGQVWRVNAAGDGYEPFGMLSEPLFADDGSGPLLNEASDGWVFPD